MNAVTLPADAVDKGSAILVCADVHHLVRFGWVLSKLMHEKIRMSSNSLDQDRDCSDGRRRDWDRLLCLQLYALRARRGTHVGFATP